MFNLTDLEVEQQIAQERYQSIIEARQVEKALSTHKPGDDRHRSV